MSNLKGWHCKLVLLSGQCFLLLGSETSGLKSSHGHELSVHLNGSGMKSQISAKSTCDCLASSLETGSWLWLDSAETKSLEVQTSRQTA